MSTKAAAKAKFTAIPEGPKIVTSTSPTLTRLPDILQVKVEDLTAKASNEAKTVTLPEAVLTHMPVEVQAKVADLLPRTVTLAQGKTIHTGDLTGVQTFTGTPYTDTLIFDSLYNPVAPKEMALFSEPTGYVGAFVPPLTEAIRFDYNFYNSVTISLTPQFTRDVDGNPVQLPSVLGSQLSGSFIKDIENVTVNMTSATAPTLTLIGSKVDNALEVKGTLYSDAPAPEGSLPVVRFWSAATVLGFEGNDTIRADGVVQISINAGVGDDAVHLGTSYNSSHIYDSPRDQHRTGDGSFWAKALPVADAYVAPFSGAFNLAPVDYVRVDEEAPTSGNDHYYLGVGEDVIYFDFGVNGHDVVHNFEVGKDRLLFYRDHVELSYTDSGDTVLTTKNYDGSFDTVTLENVRATSEQIFGGGFIVPLIDPLATYYEGIEGRLRVQSDF